MSNLAHANSFQELLADQKARALSKKVFDLSASFPRDELYSLTTQIRRSSRSVGAQIAEAWAKRRYLNHFISKLTEADGEQMETQHWLESAVDFQYLSFEQINPLLEDCAEIGRLLGGMISKANLFCNPNALKIHDEQAAYFTED